MSDIVERAKGMPADVIVRARSKDDRDTEIERLQALVDTRDERLQKVESDLFFERRLRKTEGELLRSMLAARDAEIARLKEADRA